MYALYFQTSNFLHLKCWRNFPCHFEILPREILGSWKKKIVYCSIFEYPFTYAVRFSLHWASLKLEAAIQYLNNISFYEASSWSEFKHHLSLEKELSDVLNGKPLVIFNACESKSKVFTHENCSEFLYLVFNSIEYPWFWGQKYKRMFITNFDCKLSHFKINSLWK